MANPILPSYLYNGKNKQNREIKFVDGVWIYVDDSTIVPEDKLRNFHTNGLRDAIGQIPVPYIK